MSKFSVKMRASQDDVHISGAERIINKSKIAQCVKNLVSRAILHANGDCDFINLKVEKIDDEILHLNALDVSQFNVKSVDEGRKKIKELMQSCGISNFDEIFEKFKETKNMRGAMLLDINTLTRLEPDKIRGIRATYMDSEKFSIESKKNHFKEAIVLATKVAEAPNIVGEICVSDDINYQIGYFASKKTGYCRILKLKEKDDNFGGRIFLYDGDMKDVSKTIDFLEKKCVVVKNMPNFAHDKFDFIDTELKNLKDENLYRNFLEIDEVKNLEVKMNGEKKIIFNSNDYLNLAKSKKIKRAALVAVKKYGVGTSGSRLVCGNSSAHVALEKKLAEFKNCESAILFNSGYCANLGVISAIAAADDVIFSDEFNHASIIDGCKLSNARVIVYKHNDMADLEAKICENDFKNGIVVSDAVFSMDGDILNLPEFLKISKKYNLISIIDEAHSTGVLGNGYGICAHFKTDLKPDILIGTLSKALGSEGGFCCADKKIVDYLKNKARSFIFSTAMPALAATSAMRALEILKKGDEVKKLNENIKYFNEMLDNAGINAHFDTAILKIPIGDEMCALKIAQTLYDKGFIVSAIRYPSVRKNEAILRITVSSAHKKRDIKRFTDILAEVLNDYKIKK